MMTQYHGIIAYYDTLVVSIVYINNSNKHFCELVDNLMLVFINRLYHIRFQHMLLLMVLMNPPQ